MKLKGYVSDLEFALHDVGDEQKEKLLLWHSEKLAIAFGLIRVSAGGNSNQSVYLVNFVFPEIPRGRMNLETWDDCVLQALSTRKASTF
ncbi:hypothetical protein RHMOL_Rhmol11G0142200 [Rhododendron molle]|uniref:Uncharacterized protein n=1 Tax=Rhododendron molle TaxID=49168 RepID=A0ACC0LSF9_RHOML|nr:hypothetical protein RHMOL_Rhmol11G0142200 [Rhododendron molle]